jgi:hypothetical protein
MTTSPEPMDMSIDLIEKYLYNSIGRVSAQDLERQFADVAERVQGDNFTLGAVLGALAHIASTAVVGLASAQGRRVDEFWPELAHDIRSAGGRGAAGSSAP